MAPHPEVIIEQPDRLPLTAQRVKLFGRVSAVIAAASAFSPSISAAQEFSSQRPAILASDNRGSMPVNPDIVIDADPNDLISGVVFAEVNPRPNLDGDVREVPEYKPMSRYDNKTVVYDEKTDTFMAVRSDLVKTDVFNPVSQQWEKLAQPELYGTAQERMNTILQNLLKPNRVELSNVPIENAVGLDPEEVDWYRITGSDEGLKSFQVARNAKGEPAFYIVTGGRYGFSPDLGNITSIKEMVRRLNLADPNIIDLCTISLGVTGMTADLAPGNFFPRIEEITGSGYAASFDRYSGIVIEKELATLAMTNHTVKFLGESYGIFLSRAGIPDNEAGLQKMLRVKDWRDANGDDYTTVENRQLISHIDAQIAVYAAKN